ncbi:phage portal protein [bacterium]|nr:phage portal protein [bacterium]
MGLRSWVRGLLGRPAPRRRVRGSYDAAQNGTDANHWAWVDALNANAANSPDVRKVLRERARYEADNNGYCGGLIEKLGNDLVGRCPRVQVTIPGVARDVTRGIERAFQQWARQVGLGAKLRLLDNMAVRDGEGFAILTKNPALDPYGVQLDLKLYETDQVETPFFQYADREAFSGGRLDAFGNVAEWHFLKVHPGSDVWAANYLDYDRIPAADVVHWYKPRRAGQLRGVPEIMSSLSLYGYIRRYTLATIGTAETAANISGVLKSNLPPDREGGGPQWETMEDIPTPRGALLTLPEGWDATGFRSEQPVTGYGDFKKEALAEAGAPVGAPRNIATGSSADYNYSSGRLDHGIYQRGVGVRRGDLTDRVLDKVFREWLDEAALIPGLIPDGLPVRALWTWGWYFDGFASLDPAKDAQTDKLRLETRTTTLAAIYAERGEDWEDALEQLALEERRAAELGLAKKAVKARRRRRESAYAA